MGGLTTHLALQFMENSMAKYFMFQSKPLFLHNTIHTTILVSQFILWEESSPNKLQRYFSRHKNRFGS